MGSLVGAGRNQAKTLVSPAALAAELYNRVTTAGMKTVHSHRESN